MTEHEPNFDPQLPQATATAALLALFLVGILLAIAIWFGC